MALRSKWTIRIRLLKTRLRVGVYAIELEPQPILVSLKISGLAESSPGSLAQCLDYEPICRWVIDEWPLTAHTPLLETRLNELMARVFNADKRIRDVCFGLYKTHAVPEADFVGLEREISRRQFEEQQRTQVVLPILTASELPPTKALKARAAKRPRGTRAKN